MFVRGYLYIGPYRKMTFVRLMDKMQLTQESPGPQQPPLPQITIPDINQAFAQERYILSFQSLDLSWIGPRSSHIPHGASSLL